MHLYFSAPRGGGAAQLHFSRRKLKNRIKEKATGPLLRAQKAATSGMSPIRQEIVHVCHSQNQVTVSGRKTCSDQCGTSSGWLCHQCGCMIFQHIWQELSEVLEESIEKKDEKTSV